jgi:hypothetical protein
MSVKLSDATVDTSVEGTERLVGLDGTTFKSMTPALLAAYTIDVLGDASTATPTTGDYLVGFRGEDEKRLTLDAVSAYAATYAWSAASTVTPALTGDSLLVLRSGVVYDMTVDTLSTYVLTGIQATVLNVSGLTPATLTHDDLLPICQTTTAKKATIESLETLLWTDFAAYAAALSPASAGADADKLYVLQSGVPKTISLTLMADYIAAEFIADNDLQADILGYLPTYIAALDAVTATTSTDVFYCLQGATGKKVTLAQISSYVEGQVSERPWTEVGASKYTATPASTSTITMSDTSDFLVGYPVRYQYSGSTYYGIVTAVSANALLTIAGAPLNVGAALQNLYVGRPERVVQRHFFIDTAFGSAVQDIFASVTYERFRWELADAYLVSFAATSGEADTGATEPKINVKIAGSLVSTNDSNNGLQLSSTAGTWTANSAVAVNTNYYDIARGDAVDIRCTAAGTNGDAECMSVDLTFVLE